MVDEYKEERREDLQIYIEGQKVLAVDAQSIIDLALAKAKETTDSTREEEVPSHSPDKKTITVHASREGFGFDWDIFYKQDWSGPKELRAHKFTRIPGQNGSNYYSILVTREERNIGLPGEEATVVPTGSYYYEEMGAGTQYLRGRNDSSTLEKIKKFFAALE